MTQTGEIREYHILNLGAGVQSSCLYLMSIEGLVRQFDAAIFADTQEEPAAVYRHLEWLKTMAGLPIIVTTLGKLGDDIRSGKRTRNRKARFVSIPAFTLKGDDRGRIKRQCSTEYKIDAIHRAIRSEILHLGYRQRPPKDVVVHQYFGISLDEKSRASRIWERYYVTGESRYPPHFPLIEKQMTRANCIDFLQARVPHEVPRSACVFCPLHTDTEWLRLKEAGGADWARALEIDQLLREKDAILNRDSDQVMYLHPDCKPLTQIEFTSRVNAKELQLGFGIECLGVCGV